MVDTYFSETIALNQVREICSRNRSEFLEFPGRIDNGIDGLIIVTSKHSRNTIGCICVQLKGGNSYLRGDSPYLNISSETVKRYREIGRGIAEPYILVYARANKKTYWIDLKDDDSFYHPEQDIWKIKINKEQEFKSSTFTKIQREISKTYELFDFPKIVIKNRSNNSHLLENKSLRSASRDLYNSFKQKKLFIRLGKSKKRVIFSRVGWNHITRRNRKVSRKVQSLTLLNIIPDIIQSNSPLRKVSCKKVTRNNQVYLLEKYVMEAECIFNYRYPSIINLVFLRKKTFANPSEDYLWFYSIYESNRNRNLNMKKRD
jgi:hypothetical protein